MFHDETMPSFFRRPSYSPDGSLLLVPGKIIGTLQCINNEIVKKQSRLLSPQYVHLNSFPILDKHLITCHKV